MEQGAPVENGTVEREQEGESPLVRADLEQASLGDRDFEMELLGEFLDGSPRLLASLSGALAAGDAQDLRRGAHNLKGCCWAVGARPLGRTCEQLELDARDGKLDEAPALIERIRTQFTEVEGYVRRHWGL